MSHRIPQERRCSYVVVLDERRDGEDEIFELAQYLSTISRTQFDVVVADGSRGERFERNRSILRWVSRHVPLAITGAGLCDGTVRAAIGAAAAEKVVVATADVRYTAVGLTQTCELLDLHDGVAPQDFFEPLPWWSGIEMSRLLMERAFDAAPRVGATLAVRRSALLHQRSTRGADGTRVPAGFLTVEQLEIHSSSSVVRRRPPTFGEWLRGRSAAAAQDFEYPARTIIFLGAAPLLVLVALVGGAKIAATYTLVVVLASIAMALRGALSSRGAMPLRAALFAPLWLAERSLSVYLAAFGRWRTGRISSPDERERETQRGSRVASGE